MVKAVWWQVMVHNGSQWVTAVETGGSNGAPTMTRKQQLHPCMYVLCIPAGMYLDMDCTYLDTYSHTHTHLGQFFYSNPFQCTHHPPPVSIDPANSICQVGPVLIYVCQINWRLKRVVAFKWLLPLLLVLVLITWRCFCGETSLSSSGLMRNSNLANS